MKRINFAIFLILVASSAWARELPETSNTPGGVILVTLDQETNAMPRASFRGKPVMIFRDGPEWRAVIGLSLNIKPGEHSFTTTADGRKRHYKFQVVDKNFPVQRLTISDKNKVNPTADDLVKIGLDREKIGRAFVTWSYQADPPLRFDLPVYGRFSSSFGLVRYYNNQPRARRHRGLDIAAPTGTPVHAPAAGTVVITGEYFFTGNTIFLDHGQGLLTVYNHLSKIDVSPGMRINKGDKIGEVGATGRVTGPHLHWSVILNRTMIEPMAFIRAESLAKNQGHLDRAHGAGGK